MSRRILAPISLHMSSKCADSSTPLHSAQNDILVTLFVFTIRLLKADSLNQGLSHIESTQSGDISNLREAKGYRVGKADISKNHKKRARAEGFILLLLLFFLFFFYSSRAACFAISSRIFFLVLPKRKAMTEKIIPSVHADSREMDKEKGWPLGYSALRVIWARP